MIAEAVTLPKLPKRTRAVPLVRGHRLVLEPKRESPNQDDPVAVRHWVAQQPRPWAIDVFSGAGGLSLGLADAGFSVLMGADIDGVAVETHRHNLGGVSYIGDLSNPDGLVEQLRAWGMADLDLIAGGVPCQPFSRAGRSKIRDLVKQGEREAADPRADLWRSFLNLVGQIRPRAVLLENVPDLAEWDDGAVLIGLCEGLQDLGYWVDSQVLEAHRFQVPQHRARLFLVAFQKRYRFDWPSPSHRQTPTVKRAIGDLPSIGAGQWAETLPYSAPTEPTDLLKRLRGGVPREHAAVVWDHVSRDVRPDDAMAYAMLRQGGTYKDIPKELRRYRDDIFADKYHRLEWDGLSRTITAHIAKDGYWYIHPDQDRSLSVREAARLQTFPDWFRFAGRPNQRLHQIGNAVPPLLAQAIGRRLFEELTRRGRPARGTLATGFRSTLLKWHRHHRRTYPWREDDATPWEVLLAEICLHRTRADQVAAVYKTLLDVAGTPESAVANPGDVVKVMASLGLRWRARNVARVARAIMKHHAGQVPATRTQLLALPGVGDYIANAVLSFGFRKRSVILDTNTMRIARRIYGRPKARTAQLRIDLYRLAGREGADREFNLALLDLGALTCTARRPKCEECPVRAACASRERPTVSG